MALVTLTRERLLRSAAAGAGHRSLRALARAAGVSRGSLQLVLRGERTPRQATIAKLARACLITEDALARILCGGVS